MSREAIFAAISAAVVRQAVADLGSVDERLFASAQSYFASPLAQEHIESAGLSMDLLDIMKDVAQRSTIQRHVIIEQVLTELKTIHQ